MNRPINQQYQAIQTVSKLPPNYILKTLARLLPTRDQISKLSKDDLVKLAQKKAELERLIKLDPSRFFVPHSSGGQKDFLECDDPKKRVRGYFAGNKGGKSTAGAIKIIERLLGEPIWGRATRSYKARTPARGVCFAEDFDSHKEVTVPTLLSWMPPGKLEHPTRNAAGHITEFRLKNKSLLHFRTYDQGSEKAEGKDWDIVWCDEPPPRAIYTAVFRGLVVSDGVMIITATLLKEAWLFDEAELPHVVIFQGSIHDNQWLSKQAKEDFLGSLTEEERATREEGKPVNLVGLVYKGFQDAAPYVVAPYQVPYDVPIIMAVDPHERKPVYVEYGYLTPEDEIVWFSYVFASGSLEEIFSKLRLMEDDFPTRPILCVMDPNRGRARQLGGTCWAEAFESHGYDVTMPDDDIYIGHTVMREYLKGPIPAMRWMETCRGKGGPIYQMLRYSWDDWTNRTRLERDQKEKPKDRHKDFPDLHRYVAMSNLEYSLLMQGMPKRDLAPEGWRERRIRAYA